MECQRNSPMVEMYRKKSITSKVLILGAAGKIARHAVHQFLEQEGVSLTLYLRRSGRLQKLAGDGVEVIEGDVTDTRHLQRSHKGRTSSTPTSVVMISRIRRSLWSQRLKRQVSGV